MDWSHTSTRGSARTSAEAEAIFSAAQVGAVLTDRAHSSAFPLGLVHDDEAPLTGTPTWPDLIVEDDKALLIYPRAVHGGRLFGITVSHANWRATMRTNIALFRSGRYG